MNKIRNKVLSRHALRVPFILAMAQSIVCVHSGVDFWAFIVHNVRDGNSGTGPRLSSCRKGL